MATITKKRVKRRRGQIRKAPKQSSKFLTIGVAITVIGLLVFGTFQILGSGHNQTSTASSVIQANGDSLEQLTIADNQDQQVAEAVPITDRETRFLGPASDSATVALAEAGQLGQPALLWFHADW